MTAHFRHAPARLRVDANMFALACGYAAVCLLVPLWFTEGAKKAELGLGWPCGAFRKRHFGAVRQNELETGRAVS